jgi:hypothetical protein
MTPPVEDGRARRRAGYEDTARAMVAKIEDSCLVTVSLALPVETTVEVCAR